MSPFETILVHQFSTFLLVLARVGSMVMVAPIFGTRSAPMQFRALLAVTVTLLVTPLMAMRTSANMEHLLLFSRTLVLEVLVGLLLGLGVMFLLSGIQLTGQILSQMSGAAMANVFDPTLENSVSIFSQLFYFLALVMFVLLGGHHLMMEAVLDTYTWLPPGRAIFGASYVDVLTSILTQSFLLGIRTAAPAMASLLLATLLLGLIGRTMPQINIIAVGFSVNTLLTLGILSLSIGAVAWAFPQQTATALQQMQDAIREAASG